MSRFVDVEDLPDAETDPVAAAELYLALAPVRSWGARASKQLKKYTEEHGSIETMQGTLGQVFDTYEYPAQIADELPGFGVNNYSFTLPCRTDHTAVYELLLEGFPQDANDLRKTWKVVTVVDKERCRIWATEPDMRGTPESEVVRKYRRPLTKLGKESG